MECKKNVFITINGSIDSKSLYNELKAYHMNVTDLVTRTYVYGEINLTEPFIEYILQSCYKYGEIKVELTDISDKTS